MISKIKVDHSFPDGQFFLDGFKTPFRLDRNRNSGDIMLFIRNDIPASFFYRWQVYWKFLCRVKFSKGEMAIDLL